MIRTVERQDLPQLLVLCGDHARYEGATYDPAGKHAQLEAAIWSPQPALFVLVAVEGDTLTGYASATREFSTWDADYFLHMDCLYISESHRGHGLGYQFVEQLKQLARQLHCTHLQWQTPADNHSAVRFYQRLGATSKDKKRFFLAL